MTRWRHGAPENTADNLKVASRWKAIGRPSSARRGNTGSTCGGASIKEQVMAKNSGNGSIRNGGDKRKPGTRGRAKPVPKRTGTTKSRKELSTKKKTPETFQEMVVRAVDSYNLPDHEAAVLKAFSGVGGHSIRQRLADQVHRAHAKAHLLAELAKAKAGAFANHTCLRLSGTSADRSVERR